MQNIFNLSDVQEFIAQQELGLWTKNIYDYKTKKTRSANIKDFKQEDPSITLEMLDLYDDRTLKDFSISNFEFSLLKYNAQKKPVVDKNLTTKWHDFMLNAYGDEYAELLTAWSNQKIQTIDETLKNKSKTIPETTKAKFEKLRSFYEKILKKAKSKIKESQESKALTI